jgi:hypothetical protein
MNTKIAKQKINRVFGKNNNCTYPAAVCEVDVEYMNRQKS